MIFKRLLKLPVIVNRLYRRNYYSDNIKKLYFDKINTYISQINKNENDDEGSKIFNNLMNDYNFVSNSIAEIEKETSPENKVDEEMMTLMNEEKIKLENEKSEIIDKIFNEIYEYEQSKDSERISGNSDCIFEISAGVGGKEAMLFADELCTMYNNYFNYKNWELDSVDTDRSDGVYLRHYKATVKGHFVWDHLRYEIGVHRVQRIPKTESKGRIHTSTVTLACIPITHRHSVEINDKDLKIDTKRASGAGGQHVNTTESAVRITHLPSSIQVECQEDRSQIKNREIAMRKLREILVDRQIKETFDKYLKTRKSQVGHANRNEKIRTYNFNQDRLTDHRLSSQNESKGTIFNLESFFQNPERLDDFIEILRQADRERELLSILEKL